MNWILKNFKESFKKIFRKTFRPIEEENFDEVLIKYFSFRVRTKETVLESVFLAILELKFFCCGTAMKCIFHRKSICGNKSSNDAEGGVKEEKLSMELK